jgi:hypothetical protein
VSASTIEVVWILNLGSAAFGIAVWVAWVMRNRKRWCYTVAPLSWLAHAVIYFAARLLAPHEPSALFQLWSSVLIEHAVMLLIGIGVIWLKMKTEIKHGTDS